MPKTYNIVKHLGTPKKATIVDKDGREHTVEREEKLFIQEYGGFVKCAPYDDHFVFEVPKHIIAPSFMCTCGSAAIFVGSKQYAHLGSPEGRMLVCKFHLDFGKHTTGGSRWI